MNNQPNCALVVNKKTRVLYKYLGDDVYKNLITGIEGKLLPEDAKKYFSIPARLNYMVHKNENVLSLIELGIFDFSLLNETETTITNYYSKK